MPNPPLKALEQPETVSVRTYRALRHALLQGTIEPGERLLEVTLAKRLAVSRTPVRYALTRLVDEGLAERTTGSSGVVVRDFKRELADIYGIRQVLEGYAARLAAQRIDPDELERLHDLSKKIDARVRMARETDQALEEHAQLTNEFHHRIAIASGNRRLIDLITAYREYFLSADFLKMYDRQTMRTLQDQHELILRALRRRDGFEAERLVREHFGHALAVINGVTDTDVNVNVDRHVKFR